MKPLVIPASTITTALAGAVTVIVVWALRQWASVDVPESVAQAFTVICATLTAHFTTDSPPKEVSKDAIAELSVKT